MDDRALLIGTPETCRLLEQQLELLPDAPTRIGWVLTREEDRDRCATDDGPVLGVAAELNELIDKHAPTVALISLPAVMNDLITSIRTRMRRQGVTDRFMPTLADQLEGVGPRTHFEVDLNSLLNRDPRQIDEAAVSEVITGKSVLITGAGGSIGSELARIAARYSPRVLICVDRAENALFEIDRQLARLAPNVARRALLHDVVDDRETLRQFSQLGPEVIFHAAAHKHVPMMEQHPKAAVQNNLFGTKSVADAAHLIGAERLVMISTDKAVNPTSIMGATKRLAEQYVQYLNGRSTTSFSVVRFGNVLGSAGSVLEIWSRQIADGGPITVTHPEMTRYFMTIPEAASLVIQSAAISNGERAQGEVMLLDMGDPVRIVDLAQNFIHAHGLRSSDDRSETNSTTGVMPIVFTGIRPGEKLHEQLAFDAESMRPTQHRDIHVWELASPTERQINRMLNKLSTISWQDSPQDIAEMIRAVSPDAAASIRPDITSNTLELC